MSYVLSCYLLNCVFRCRSKKTSKLCITGFCEGNPLVTNGFPSQMASIKKWLFAIFLWLTKNSAQKFHDIFHEPNSFQLVFKFSGSGYCFVLCIPLWHGWCGCRYGDSYNAWKIIHRKIFQNVVIQISCNRNDKIVELSLIQTSWII